jgi:hypothetical protein
MTKYLGVGALVLIVTALGVGAVFAQTATPPTANTPQAHAGFFHGAQGVCGQAGLDAAAKALKMTTQDLTAQLWGGQTLSGLADKAGVKIADVQSAVQAACQQAQKDAINQAVKDGKITQANADWLIEGIDKGFIGARADWVWASAKMGGRGMMGHPGFFFRVPEDCPSTPMFQ